ncbi:MAG: AraC family transcriptional regulator [Lachnospiraceae bacterium]|nr:AraC family transcriptional regulator [Lachnospiraceae bacterium]
MDFYKYPLTKLFHIPQIVTIHYFEYSKDFKFEGESHDFWEFLCVDKGEVTVTADQAAHKLKKGSIIFHKPGQFHSVATDGVIAPNLVVISFVCSSPAMSFFEDKILPLGETERSLLAAVLAEAGDAFLTPLDNPYTRQLSGNPGQRPGSEQIIQLSLEHFLISLYRKSCQPPSDARLNKSVKLKRDDETFRHIMIYMEDRLTETLTLEQICRDNLMGVSQLQNLFRNKCGCGIIEYFSRMKITRAKELIREKNMNFTQIADYLGYNSIHYFSRQFKKITGMTPSEYALSIQAFSK